MNVKVRNSVNMKLMALKAQSGKILIDLENECRDACATLLEARIRLDSLSKQVTDNPYYTEDDEREIDSVKSHVISNIKVVLNEYSPEEDK